MAALGPTGLQDCAAGTGAHAIAEAMLLGATAVIGLECALHARLLDRVAGKPAYFCLGSVDPLQTARVALYRGICIFSACGKPATFAFPAS